jgi:CO/xanthine dehydrogenase FAD-binding subunit
MISLVAALDGVCTIWKADGSEQIIKIVDFIAGPQRTVLAPGDLLRQIDVPLAALKRRAAFRQISLTPVGRSGALVIGTRGPDGDLGLTITASTKRPIQLRFAAMPDSDELRGAVLRDIPDGLYHDDIHGKPAWRQAMTLRLAEQVRGELMDQALP